MARKTQDRTAAWTAILVGVLIVALAAIGYAVWSGRVAKPPLPRSINVDLTLPRAPPIPEAPAIPSAPIPKPK